MRWLSFLLLFVSVCVVQGADLDRERAKILETDKQWAAVVVEGKDVDRMVSFWSDDASVFAPGRPAIVGKAAIRAFVQESLAVPGFKLQWETTKVTLSADGTMAYGIATNRTSFNDAQGKQITIDGKAVTVWHKQPSGEWKCVIDIWNENPPPAK